MNGAEREFLSQINGALEYQNLLPYTESGERKWVIRKGRGWPTRALVDGVYHYVVMPDGEVRFSECPRPRSEMNHPELAKGKEVIAAGTFTLHNAEVVRIDNESGHYSPRGDSVDYALIAFRHWNAPISEQIKKDTSWEIYNNY